MPPPFPPREPSKAGQYFAGLGIGLLVLLVALLIVPQVINAGIQVTGAGTSNTLIAVLVGFGAVLIGGIVASIVFLRRPRQRFIGYGLLTVFLILPIVIGVACALIIYSLSPH